MISALLTSYSSFFKIIGLAVDRPQSFYRGVVQEVNLAVLLGLYVQIIIAVMAFNAIVFTVGQTDGSQDFEVFYFVVGVMNAFIGASVFSLTFWGALRVAREPATLSDVAKFVFVTFVALAIVTLLVSTLCTYIVYIATGGFAYQSDWQNPEPPIVGIIYAIEMYVFPALAILAVATLLYVSTGRSLRIMACFAAAGIVHVAAVVPLTTSLWMQILSLNYLGS